MLPAFSETGQGTKNNTSTTAFEDTIAQSNTDINLNPSPRSQPRPRPDEVDLNGVNNWVTDANVPAHNNLGFRVLAGATLTIYPGVTVKFDPGTQLLVEGKLYIKGTEQAMVTLTSRAGTPAKGDWGGIKFTPNSIGYVNHSKITYSIYGVNLIKTTNVKVANCSINNVQMAIKIENGSVNSIIENNNITNSDAGVAIYDSTNNQIINNKFNGITYTAMAISDKSSSNIIDGNNINAPGERGISLSAAANNNTIKSNLIYSCPQEGIRCSNSKFNDFYKNQIYSNKIGMKFYTGSNNNIVDDNLIFSNNDIGVEFDNVKDCKILRTTLWDNNFEVAAKASTGLVLEDITINSTNLHIDLNTGSIMHLINSSFYDNLVFVKDTSQLHVYWYLVVELLDADGNLKTGNLRITDNQKTEIFPKTSLSTGTTKLQCLGYIKDATSIKNSMNPYWLEAEVGIQKFKYGVDLEKGNKKFAIKFAPFPEKINFPEDTKLELDFESYFNNFESTTYKVDVKDGGNISYAFDQPTLKLFATPPKDWNAEVTIQISAVPHLGDPDVRTVMLKVTPLNDPPIITKKIPNQLKIEGSPMWSLNLTDHVFDPDLIYGDKITWYISGVNESLLNVTISTSDNNYKQELIFRLHDQHIFGNDDIILSVEDSSGESAWQEFWINITPENDKPELSKAGFYPKTGSPVTEFTFNVQYFDIDGDLPDYINLKINNIMSYQLTEQDQNDNNVKDGKEYFYKIKLTSHTYYYWFECYDGNGGYAKTENLSGPIVTSEEFGSLSGMVVDKDTGEKLPDADIRLWDILNSSFIITVKTDALGNYSILNLNPGINRYQIFASVSGYKDSKIYNKTIIKGIFSIQNFELEKLPVEIGDTKITKVWINANRTSIVQYSSISFTGFAEDLDGDVLTYNWNFNDDTRIITGKQVSHAFHIYGNITVILTVEDTDGNNLTSTINITIEPHSDSDKNGDSDDFNENFIRTNIIPLLLVIILIIVILVFLSAYIQIRRRNAEVEAQLKAEEDKMERRRRAVERRKRKREREMDYVDREKRNVEQINLLITDLHHKKDSKKKKDTISTGDKKRNKRETKETKSAETEDYFEINEDDLEEISEPKIAKKIKNKTKPKSRSRPKSNSIKRKGSKL